MEFNKNYLVENKLKIKEKKIPFYLFILLNKYYSLKKNSYNSNIIQYFQLDKFHLKKLKLNYALCIRSI